MKKFLIIMLIGCGAVQSKAQNLMQIKPLDSLLIKPKSNNQFEALNKKLQQQLLQLPAQKLNNLQLLASNEQFYSRMPVADLNGTTEKMPIVDLNNQSIKPLIRVKKIDIVNPDDRGTKLYP
jgi:hypothetical protein